MTTLENNDQFKAMLDALDAATKMPPAQRLQRNATIAAIRAQAIQAIATRPGEANIWAIVAEMALQAETEGGFRLPVPTIQRNVECPKCKATGEFCWGAGCGKCYDCSGTGFVTAGQARYRLANVPPILVREQQAAASGTTPFKANPELPLSSLVNTASDDLMIDPIPF